MMNVTCSECIRKQFCCKRAWHHVGTRCEHCGNDERGLAPEPRSVGRCCVDLVDGDHHEACELGRATKTVASLRNALKKARR